MYSTLFPTKLRRRQHGIYCNEQLELSTKLSWLHSCNLIQYITDIAIMMKHLLAEYNLSETNMARDATGITMRTSHDR